MTHDERRARAIAKAFGLPWEQSGVIRKGQLMDAVEAIRRSDDAAGFVLVPRQLTDRMRSEGESAASFGFGKPVDDDAIERVWTAMLAAATGDDDAK